MGWEGVLFLYFPVPKTKKKTGMVAWTRQPGPVVGLGTEEEERLAGEPASVGHAPMVSQPVRPRPGAWPLPSPSLPCALPPRPADLSLSRVHMADRHHAWRGTSLPEHQHVSHLLPPYFEKTVVLDKIWVEH